MQIVNFILNNLPTILLLIVFMSYIAFWVKEFFLLPNDKRLDKVKEWLLYAVTEAEKELGGGTGKLKLRKVYDMFIDKFSAVSSLITFEKFSDMVDEVLEEMREILDTNQNVQEYVYGEEVNINE